MAASDRIIHAETRACTALRALRFSEPVTHVYNPLEYAEKPHRRYLRRFAGAPREALLLGMNPGPFGMAQTGVPFGEIAAVRDWMGVHEAVAKPLNEHPKRPIDGFECKRTEVSGQRLWGWASTAYPNADDFFSRFFVHNYCPLVFMADSGRNITPDKLSAPERESLFAICDTLLASIVDAIRPQGIIGVGAFAEQCAKRVFGNRYPIGRIPHPSPASPSANKDWAAMATRAMREIGYTFG